jgi:CheY-like chemotaxis protein
MDADDHPSARFAPRFLVLIVEDDPAVRSVAVDILEDLGFRTAEAKSVRDALDYLTEHAPDVGLIFTDYEFPGRLDGMDLARVASLRWPWIKLLMTSGGARVYDVLENVAFLPKPWCAADIGAHIDWESARAEGSHGRRNETPVHRRD